MSAHQSDDTYRRLAGEALTTSWLAVRLGIEPLRLNAMRRAGELLAIRPPGSQEYLYPAWQFDAARKPLPVLPRLLGAAKKAGIDELRLHELMQTKAGLLGARRLVDVLREGGDEHVLAAIESAAR